MALPQSPDHGDRITNQSEDLFYFTALRSKFVEVITRQSVHFANLTSELLEPLDPCFRSAECIEILHDRQINIDFGGCSVGQR